jgi:hypothetical protein
VKASNRIGSLGHCARQCDEKTITEMSDRIIRTGMRRDYLKAGEIVETNV